MRAAWRPIGGAVIDQLGHAAEPPVAPMMSSTSSLPPDLIQAYRETHYRVHGDEAFTLHVDEHCQALEQAHARHRATSSAYITAFNPYSEDVGEAVNHERHQALRAELSRRSLPFAEGAGQHPSNQWPAETSLLVFGISLESAKALGRSWEQNAIVFSGADAVPRLELLR